MAVVTIEHLTGNSLEVEPTGQGGCTAKWQKWQQCHCQHHFRSISQVAAPSICPIKLPSVQVYCLATHYLVQNCIAARRHFAMSVTLLLPAFNVSFYLC